MSEPFSMGKHFAKSPCHWCGKPISNAGLGATSHYRKHVREGLLVEVDGPGGLGFKRTNNPLPERTQSDG